MVCCVYGEQQRGQQQQRKQEALKTHKPTHLPMVCCVSMVNSSADSRPSKPTKHVLSSLGGGTGGFHEGQLRGVGFAGLQ